MKPITLATALLLSFAVRTVAAPLAVGDEAPPLKIDNWVKNGPVNLADGKDKNIYVIEFWATWCPPCRMSIPHLSKLQKEYADKGVVVVGISNEDLDKVKNFVASQTNMDYNVGVDVAGDTYKAYMDGVAGIPHAYIVGKNGKILWAGHPLEIDDVLAKVVENNYNPENGKAIAELKKKLQTALQSRDLDGATKAADEILKMDPDDQMALRFRLFVFQQKHDWNGAGTYLDQLIAAHPDKNRLWLIRLDIARQTKHGDEIKGIVEKYIENFKSDAAKLNTIAWTLADSKPFNAVPLELAIKAAKLAVANAPNDDKPMKAAFLDTLARCYYAVGRLDKAISTQEQALELEKGEEDAAKFEKSLNFYKKALEFGKNL